MSIKKFALIFVFFFFFFFFKQDVEKAFQYGEIIGYNVFVISEDGANMTHYTEDQYIQLPGKIDLTYRGHPLLISHAYYDLKVMVWRALGHQKQTSGPQK